MSIVKFGRKQLGNPSPANISSIIAVFTVIASIVATWVGTANFIPAKPSTIIQSLLTLLIAIANGVKPFFGVETNQQRVDVEDVTEMETKK